MRPYPPDISVCILDRASLESLLHVGTFGLSTEHLVHAGELDEIKEVYLCDSSKILYALKRVPGIWHHVAFTPTGSRLTINKARPKEYRPRTNSTSRLKEGRKTSRVWDPSPKPKAFDLTGPYKIYVGNLSYELTDTALLKVFKKFGTVKSASIVIDPMSNRSKGFGFVEMSSESEVESAIDALHDEVVLNNGNLVSDYNSSQTDTLSDYGTTVLSIIETASRELARLICYEPGKLQDLEWRDLERMLAVVFDGIGYAVQLTRGAKDGGKDIIIEFVASRQKQSYYVEVKHWVSGQKVGSNTVQEFLSVVVRDQKQAGIIISTSGFSASAMEGITEIERLRFGNSDTVVSLCRTYLNTASGLIYPLNYKDLLFAFTQDITKADE